MGENDPVDIMLDKVQQLGLKLSSMMDFRKATGKDVWEMDKPTAPDICALLWAILRREKPELLQSDISDLIDIKDMGRIGKVVSELMIEAMPEAKKKKQGRGAA